MVPGHVSIVSHPSPANPGLQKHLPPRHKPFPEHSAIGQGSIVLQCLPLKPGAQKQLPYLHTPSLSHPCVPQSSTYSQDVPWYPGEQSHISLPSRSVHAPLELVQLREHSVVGETFLFVSLKRSGASVAVDRAASALAVGSAVVGGSIIIMLIIIIQ